MSEITAKLHIRCCFLQIFTITTSLRYARCCLRCMTRSVMALSCSPDNICNHLLHRFHLHKYLGMINYQRLRLSLGPRQWTGAPVAAEERQVILPPQQQTEKPRAVPGPTPWERTEPREGERQRERQRKGTGEGKRERTSQWLAREAGGLSLSGLKSCPQFICETKKLKQVKIFHHIITATVYCPKRQISIVEFESLLSCSHSNSDPTQLETLQLIRMCAVSVYIIPIYRSLIPRFKNEK